MGKIYNNVDELPDLSNEPIHQLDPTTNTVKTYNNIDELPDLKKKVISSDSGNGSANGEQDSLPTPKDEIPIVKLEPPKDLQDPFDLVKQYKELSEAQINPTEEEMGRSQGMAKSRPDEVKRKQAEDLKIFIKETTGVDDPDKFYDEVNGLDQNDFAKYDWASKQSLLKQREENNPAYHRTIARLKWEKGIDKALTNHFFIDNGTPQDLELRQKEYQYTKDVVDNALKGIEATDDYETKRKNAQQIAKVIDTYGGEDKEDLLKNFGTELSIVYGKAAADEGDASFKNNPLSKFLNPNQLAAYNFIQDTAPEQVDGYAAAFIDPANIKDNFDAQIGREEKLKRLDEIGLQLKASYANENLNALGNQAKNLGLDVQGETGTTSDDPFSKILSQAKEEEKSLHTKYPNAGQIDADEFAQELLGQKNTGLNWLALETGKATENTAKGIWDLVSEPFRTDESKAIHQAETMGSAKQSELQTHLTQDKATTQTFTPSLSESLKKDIAAIKDNKDLTDKEKRSKVVDLLMFRPDEWQRTPIEGGKTNLGLTSLMYGIGGLAANLAPFMALEGLTGGGATASGLRKFTSAFTSAAATGFHDAYVQALEEGVPNPYAHAMRVTAINSAAMAGAGTPAAIRKMLGSTKGAIGDLVSKMTDEEITAALRQTPKALGIFQKAYNLGKKVVTATGTGLKEGAKVTSFITAGQAANDLMDGKLKSLPDYLKQAAIETLKFGIFGGLTGSLGKINDKATDINKASLFSAGKDPKAFLEAVDQKLEAGTISQKDADQVKLNVEKAAKVFDNVPMVDAKGKPLPEVAQRDLLFLKMQEKDIDENLKKDIPESLANKLGERINDLHEKMDKIYKGTYLDELPKPKVEEPKANTLVNVADENARRLLDKMHEPETTETISSPAIEHLDENGNVVKAVSPEPIVVTKTNVNAETQTPQEPTSEGTTPIAEGNERNATETGSIKSEDVGENTPPPNEPKEVENDEGGKKVGASHESLKNISERLGLEQPERGTFLTPKEQLDRGKLLLSEGAAPQEVADNFNKDGKVSADEISVARAHHENLHRAADKALDDFGINSDEYKKAIQEAHDWDKNVIKKMGTAAGGAFSALQGETDLDTGSFTAVKRAVEEESGKPLTPSQTKEVTTLTNRVKTLETKVEDLKAKLTESIDKAVEEGGGKDAAKNIKQKAKTIADIIRKGKLSRPDTFSAATPASLVWDGALETAAKTVEALGTVAQAIKDGIEHIQKSEWYKNLSEEKKKDAEKEFSDYFKNTVNNKDIFSKFVDRKDSNFTPEEVKEIWNYAKENYVDKGRSFEDMLTGVAHDLSLKRRQVLDALEKPKGVKQISNEMYTLQNKRNDAVNQAKIWVKQANTPRIAKFFKAIPTLFFRAKTFGHGTVGAITHAGTSIFKPSRWKAYFPFFIKQFKFAFGSTAEYEKAMEHLRNDPDFTFWKRAGLAVDPKEKYDDYQGDFAKKEPSKYSLVRFFKRLGVAGDRGFNALKVLRLDLAKSYYDKLPESQKNDPNTAKEIAKLVNHGTGTSEVNLPSAANVFFFAPKLEISRWQRLVTDPAKAMSTLTAWGKATPADKAAAIRVAKNAGELVATYASLLAANAAILSLSGSQSKVNFTDPTRNDFLKFKINGKVLDVTGGMLSTFTFLSNLLTLPFKTKNDLNRKTPKEELKTKTFDYVTGKFSPLLSTVKDITSQQDFKGNILPWSNEPIPKGKEKLTWGQYFAENQTPIPVAEAFKEAKISMQSKGMTEYQFNDIMKGLFTGVLTGGTGAKLSDEPKDFKPLTITVKNPKTGTKREITEEEQKQYDAKKQELSAAILGKTKSDSKIHIDRYGDPYLVDKSTTIDTKGKVVSFDKLTKEQLETFNKKVESKAGREAKKQLFKDESK